MKRYGISLLICLTVLFLNSPFPVLAESRAGKTDQADMRRLEGRWVRPDGGYVLDITDVRKEGRLKAAYYNPRPINVARAGYKNRNGMLVVFIELRDVNYPGSFYELHYDPGTDRLKGTYFQAVEKRTFNIEFMRQER